MLFTAFSLIICHKFMNKLEHLMNNLKIKDCERTPKVFKSTIGIIHFKILPEVYF